MSFGTGGIFGNPRVKRGRMGSIEPDYTDMGSIIPGMGDMQAMDGPQTQGKPKFFGQGGAGRAIAGTLGDALLQMSGMRPIYGPMMQDRQALAAQEKAMMRKRAWELEDAARKGPELTPFQKSLAAANIDPTSPQGLALARQYVEQQADPIIQTTQTTDQGTFLTGIPRSRLMGAPTAPVGKLTPIGGGQPMAAGPAAAAMSVAQFQALAQSMGPSAAAEYVRRNQIVVK